MVMMVFPWLLVVVVVVILVVVVVVGVGVGVFASWIADRITRQE